MADKSQARRKEDDPRFDFMKRYGVDTRTGGVYEEPVKHITDAKDVKLNSKEHDSVLNKFGINSQGEVLRTDERPAGHDGDHPDDWWRLGGGSHKLSDLVTGAPAQHGTLATVGMSALRGGKDVMDTVAHGVGAAGTGAADFLSQHGVIPQSWAKGAHKSYDQMVAEDKAGQEAFRGEYGDTVPGMLGRGAGQVVASAPLLGGAGEVLSGAGRVAGAAANRMGPLIGDAARSAGNFLSGSGGAVSAAVPGAAAGAGGAALSSSQSDESLYHQMLQGGGIGGAFGAAGSVVGNTVRGMLTPGTANEAARLADAAVNRYGIPLSADQISTNPMVKTIGSVSEHLPGGEAKTAFNEAQRRVAYRSISHEIGEDDDALTTGLLNRAKARNSPIFENAAGQLDIIHADPQLVNQVQNIAAAVPSVLKRSEQDIVHSNIRDIAERFNRGNNYINGTDYLSLTKKGTPLERITKHANPDIRRFGNELKDALDGALERSAALSGRTDIVDNLAQARREWRNIKLLEPLAKGNPTGEVSPAAFRSLMAERTPIGEKARIINHFLKPEKSSGTAERTSAMKMLQNPLTALGVGAGGGALTALTASGLLGGAGAGAGGYVVNRAVGAGMTNQNNVRNIIDRQMGRTQPNSYLAQAAQAGGAIDRNIGARRSLAQGYQSLLEQGQQQTREPLRLQMSKDYGYPVEDQQQLPHFAQGGSFDVGGQGDQDNQFVQFMARPGEKVTVQTPEQQAANVAPPQNINAPAWPAMTGAPSSISQSFADPQQPQETAAAPDTRPNAMGIDWEKGTINGQKMPANVMSRMRRGEALMGLVPGALLPQTGLELNRAVHEGDIPAAGGYAAQAAGDVLIPKILQHALAPAGKAVGSTAARLLGGPLAAGGAGAATVAGMQAAGAGEEQKPFALKETAVGDDEVKLPEVRKPESETDPNAEFRKAHKGFTQSQWDRINGAKGEAAKNDLRTKYDADNTKSDEALAGRNKSAEDAYHTAVGKREENIAQTKAELAAIPAEDRQRYLAMDPEDRKNMRQNLMTSAKEAKTKAEAEALSKQPFKVRYKTLSDYLPATGVALAGAFPALMTYAPGHAARVAMREWHTTADAADKFLKSGDMAAAQTEVNKLRGLMETHAEAAQDAPKGWLSKVAGGAKKLASKPALIAASATLPFDTEFLGPNAWDKAMLNPGDPGYEHASEQLGSPANWGSALAQGVGQAIAPVTVGKGLAEVAKHYRTPNAPIGESRGHIKTYDDRIAAQNQVRQDALNQSQADRDFKANQAKLQRAAATRQQNKLAAATAANPSASVQDSGYDKITAKKKKKT